MVVLERISQLLNQILVCIAGLFLIGMIFLTCTNVFLRFVWIPVSGTFELMGYFGAVLTAFTLGYTQLKHGYISVDIVVLRFSKKVQVVLHAVNHAICMVFFALVAWQILKYGTNLWETGEVTETLQIIYYPFTYGVALGCAVLSLVFFTELLKLFMNQRGDEG